MISLTNEQLEALRQGMTIDEVMKMNEPEVSEIEYLVKDYPFEDHDGITFQTCVEELTSYPPKIKESVYTLIQGCMAFITDSCSYLIKDKDDELGMITYTICGPNELKQKFNFSISMAYSQMEFDRINEQKRQKKQKLLTSRIITINLSKMIFHDTELRNALTKYPSVHLLQIVKNCFSLRRPPIRALYLDPKITYKPDLAKKFIDFISSRIKNPTAWIDQIDTIKYQMIHPRKKACRFYLNFEASGNAGKSFSTAGISKMFGQFAMINVSPKATKDQFNSWIEGNLYISFEEAENENYSDKEVNTFVKRWTSTEMSSRGMREVMKKGKNNAIGVMTANDPGLYGLSRSDEATKRRLVVAMFKPNDLTKEQWDDMKDVIDDKSFGYSLYKYIAEEYQISKSYNPDKYVSEYDVWDELNSLKKNPVETFNELLALYDESDYCSKYEVNYNIVQKYEGSRKTYYYIELKHALENFKRHLQLCGNRTITAENFKENMEKLGWSYDNKKKMDCKQKSVFFRDVFNEVKPDISSDDCI